MTITDLDQEPTDTSASSTLCWTEDSTVTITPGLYLWAFARRTARRLREALTRLGVCVVSALLRLDWRLDVAVPVDIWGVAGNDLDACFAADRLLCHAANHVVVSAPDAGPSGWRDLGRASVEQIHEVVAEVDTVAVFGRPAKVWSVSAVITASITVAARDAHHVGTYADIQPLASQQLMQSQISGTDRIRRTPVRRRRLR